MEVRYGDLVRLAYDAEGGGLLGAEGVLNNECRLVDSHTTSMDQTVFRISPSYQYSAAKELREFEAEKAVDISNGVAADEPNETDESQRRALTRGKINEDKQNDAAQQQRCGEPVLYGDTIQLQHVISGKFLTIVTTETALLERENLCVYLDPAGNMGSHLKLVARMKIDEEFGTVMNNTELFLKVHLSKT